MQYQYVYKFVTVVSCLPPPAPTCCVIINICFVSVCVAQKAAHFW